MKKTEEDAFGRFFKSGKAVGYQGAMLTATHLVERMMERGATVEQIHRALKLLTAHAEHQFAEFREAADEKDRWPLPDPRLPIGYELDDLINQALDSPS